MILRCLAALLVALVFTTCLTPIVIYVAKKLKLRQTVLQYVDNHMSKSGTPTMGGMAFTVSMCVSSLIFFRGDKTLAVLILVITLGYGVVGFLDDFIKVWFRQNKGLSAWQKIVFQTAVALIVAIFAYKSPFVGDEQYLPITFRTFSLKTFAVPYYILVFLAASNSVNLIDGLDGLAVGVTKNYLICYISIVAVAERLLGINIANRMEAENIAVLVCSAIGSLIAFNCFNAYPAKIFMGDTGSLALGGMIAGLSVVTGTTLLLPVVGIMYVITALSVIIQVIHYKRTEKRVFLMSPIHHHFERKGVHENRIVTVYDAITLVAGGVLCCLILLFA